VQSDERSLHVPRLRIHGPVRLKALARVLAVLRIYPEDSEEGTRSKVVEELAKRLPKDYHLVKVLEEPVAFGYSAIVAYVSMPEDVEGGTAELERLVASVPGVQELEVLSVSRVE